MKTHQEAIKENYEASFKGAMAAKNGHKLDANPYPETSDLHFVWLIAWTDKRLSMIKKQ